MLVLLSVLQDYMKIDETLYIHRNKFNLATLPFTEGARLNTGVDIVIFALKRFNGHLD